MTTSKSGHAAVRSFAPLSVVPTPAPEQAIPAEPYPVISREAKLRADILAGKMRRIQAALASFTSSAMLKEARLLADEVERDLPGFLMALRS